MQNIFLRETYIFGAGNLQIIDEGHLCFRELVKHYFAVYHVSKKFQSSSKPFNFNYYRRRYIVIEYTGS